MNNKDLQKLEEVTNKLGWKLNISENEILFSKFSSAGQDFNLSFNNSSNLENLLNELDNYINNFDCSEEAYLWLDNTGHGINGAPYDMKDVYRDMEECLELTNELYNELVEIN